MCLPSTHLRWLWLLWSLLGFGYFMGVGVKMAFGFYAAGDSYLGTFRQWLLSDCFGFEQDVSLVVCVVFEGVLVLVVFA